LRDEEQNGKSGDGRGQIRPSPLPPKQPEGHRQSDGDLQQPEGKLRQGGW
jgi:hypothetical protein